MAIGGTPCGEGSGYTSTYGIPVTFFSLSRSIDVDATLTSWCVYCYKAGTVKLKIFRADGSYYRFIGESPLTAVVSGWNVNLPCDIDVHKDDLVGVYDQDSGVVFTYSSIDGKLRTGEVSDDYLKSDWLSAGSPWVGVEGTTVKAFYFTKDNNIDFDCKAIPDDTTIRCEAVVTFSDSEIGKRYWVNWIIRQPNGQDFAPYSEYAYATSTVTFYMNKALSGLVAGTYTIKSVTVSQG